MSQKIDGAFQQHRLGIIYTAVAFAAWGVLPIYWKMLRAVPSLEILAHRILWSLVFTCIVLAIQQRLLIRQVLKEPGRRRALILSSALIGMNWLTYVYAVNSEHLLEASMGYYINPLLSVILGMVVLKERLNALQIIAFLLACVGVIYLTMDYGRLPWIALLLAGAFALYGLLKKTTEVDSMESLMIETLFLSPVAFCIICYQMIVGRGALFSMSAVTDILLIFAGVVTVLPLYWFTQGAKRIRLSSVGFLQYIAPTFMLVIGVLIFHEPFTRAHLVSFTCVWIALVLYSLTLRRKSAT